MWNIAKLAQGIPIVHASVETTQTLEVRINVVEVVFQPTHDSTHFMVFSVTCVIVSLTLILSCMLVYTDDTWRSSAPTNILA